MIVRIWSTGYTPGRIGEFIAFAEQRLQPFFRGQDGCLACFFTHDEQEWRTITFWRDTAAVEAVKDSTIYRAMLADLVDSGLLLGAQQVKKLKFAGGGLYGQLPL
ncbi:MAG: antibiotic biosynthesis monooxygenase [Ferrovibrio sp.]|uniref:antibiotic biosynthesis monooxygenase n=1 Tax=Ferrovibrio sp. TaxID=1917215 RepID=UPI002628EB59|nr:antibiotic biosynthesis monooxygenase [Ferrovibrio sp.]MCW0236203.1 antibiotic biosynthesis monooxygenase [Ferrovibrio sp.]